MYLFYFLGTCVCVCALVWGKCAVEYTCRSQSLQVHHFSDRVSHWTRSAAPWLCCLASKHLRSSLPPGAGDTGAPGFHTGTWGPDPGPHACASALDPVGHLLPYKLLKEWHIWHSDSHIYTYLFLLKCFEVHNNHLYKLRKWKFSEHACQWMSTLRAN